MKRFALVGFPDGLANQDRGGFILGEPQNKKTDKTFPLPRVSYLNPATSKIAADLWQNIIPSQPLSPK
ncbi:hypothetical protein [Chamaesiphon sp. VAR_48_metabat_403]|uniref:hypothetical protein n=1 Tax=Chamaesiphon sp. VAR_48_metabat_403 TaxID=2964700 RepID=UPI00286E160C|nr:hypothetical protein [Chamaesiphon sp. VAR_48_metabat_403]